MHSGAVQLDFTAQVHCHRTGPIPTLNCFVLHQNAGIHPQNVDILHQGVEPCSFAVMPATFVARRSLLRGEYTNRYTSEEA